MDSPNNYHGEYAPYEDYDYGSDGSRNTALTEEYDSVEGGETEYDYSKYDYADGILLPLPLDTFMRGLYGDVIPLNTPCMPYKEESGSYDQLFVSSLNSGHSTRVLVGDNEDTIAVTARCIMRNITGDLPLQHAMRILVGGLKRDADDGRYMVHSGMGIEVLSQGDLQGEEGYWYPPLSVAESKLSSELDGLEIQVEGSSSKLPVDAREQKVTHGVVGIIDCNTLLTMFPGTRQWQVSAEERLFKEEWKGYICPLRTSLGPGGGCWRSLVGGIQIRVCNASVVLQLQLLGEAIDGMKPCPLGADHDGHATTLWLGGVPFTTCRCVMPVLETAFRSVETSEYNRITFHVYNDARDMVVSYNTGALMKFVGCVGYMDNIMFSQGLERWMVVGTEPEVLPSILDGVKLLCTLSSLTPYQYHNPPARAALSSHYILQAVSPPYSTVNYHMKPMYSEPPIVVTQECQEAFVDTTMVPGLNVLTVYLSTDLSYEDAFLMSASCAQRFRCSVESVVPVTDEECAKYPEGTTIEPCSARWWPIPIEGTVQGFKVTSTGERRMRIRRETCAVTGDKFATWHGQKGVVTVMPDHTMPLLPDGRTAELVMGSTTLIKRGTMGQLMESYVQNVVGDGPVISDYTPGTRAEMQTIIVRDRIPSCHDEARDVEVHYGMIRLLQSCHMTFDRHQFTRYKTSAFSKAPRAGRSTGGDVHLGEMKIQQMVGNGLSNCLEELHIKGNMSVVEVCSGCGCIRMLCDCTGGSRGSVSMRLPSSIVDVATRVLVCSNLSLSIK